MNKELGYLVENQFFFSTKIKLVFLWALHRTGVKQYCIDYDKSLWAFLWCEKNRILQKKIGREVFLDLTIRKIKNTKV